MTTFKVETVDGKETTVEVNLDPNGGSLEVILEDVLKPGGFLSGTELIVAPGRQTKGGDIIIFGSAIVAIRAG